MKSIGFTLVLFLTINCFAQSSTSHYKKVYKIDAHHQDWALVKTVANTYGFIDKSGKEIVQAIYSRIYNFEIQKDGKKYAMIKNVAGAFGYIDENGKEIVEGIHWKKEEAIQKLNYYFTSK
ncbi:WG repeat-containing protein [Flavobacterium sp.]|jgi:hypothetical protein|uniref:WG repeat-containing protein n=1 Tax=Flavobacterium sp. TaxID=239 RepID=UPI0037C0B71B